MTWRRSGELARFAFAKQVAHAASADLRMFRIRADIHAAITGLACEGGSETPEKPVGTVFFSVRYKGRFHNERQLFRGTPSEIREKSCLFLYEFILKVIGA